jgi:hypothetical protein
VVDDPDQVMVALRGSVLDGQVVEEGIGGTLLVADVDPDRLLDVWRAARSVVARTGRWPVLTGTGELDAEPSVAEVAALERAGRTVDPWLVFRRCRDEDPIGEDALGSYVPGLFGAELVARAAAELDLPTTGPVLERWIWRTLLVDPVLAERAHDSAASLVGTRTWFTPVQVQLVLLPTPTQWLAPAWVSYFGALDRQRIEGLAAAIRQWERLWGAELVACWGTMLQFVVARRPALDEQAWQLAEQILAVGGSLQMPPWQLAFALTRSDAWFLHDRP